jgi:hypothetical protein
MKLLILLFPPASCYVQFNIIFPILSTSFKTVSFQQGSNRPKLSSLCGRNWLFCTTQFWWKPKVGLQWLRWLVASLLPRRLGFDPRSVHVR